MSIFSMGNIKQSFLINPLVFCRRHFCCCFSFCQESAQILKFGLFGLFASMVRSQPTPERGKKPTIPEDFDDIIHGSGFLTPNYGKLASLHGV